jgi:hypothetical protein
MSMEKQQISIYELGGGLEVLSGQPRGQLFLGKLIGAIRPQDEYTPLFLNFKGVKVATSSFLRAGILAFRDHCVRMGLNLYPVLANINDEIADDLKIMLEKCGDAFVVCDLGDDEQASSIRVIGSLDETQRLTLEAVILEGETDAATLKEKHKNTESIGTTGWNNRLTSLAEKGLVVEVKRGRGKLYRPVLEFT